MKKNLLICGALLAALTITACASASGASAPVPTAAPAVSAAPGTAERSRRWYYNDKQMQYTKADHALLQSFQFTNYESMSVAEFNARVLDRTNEAAYHKTEESLERLRWSLPDTDPLSPFFETVICRTWDECEIKHYNACERKKLPYTGGCAEYEKYGDVYGDQVLIAGGYADFWYSYEMPDETKITVAEREAFLKGVEDGIQAFLDKQTEAAMKKEETMEKALQAELDRLLKALSSDKIKAADGDMSYCWDSMY